MDGGIVRRRLTFTGDVQGVGFRYRARMAAREEDVTGWIRNEWDGSVVMEIQGTPEQISRVLRSVEAGRYIWIEQMRTEEIPLEEHEYYFQVTG